MLIDLLLYWVPCTGWMCYDFWELGLYVITYVPTVTNKLLFDLVRSFYDYSARRGDILLDI